jgi:pimeloyl-ACP methyl ester carboxylesterase
MRLVLLATLLASPAWADGPKDNLADNVRPVPPPGIKVPDDVRRELQASVDELGKEIDGLKVALAKKPGGPELIPDVQIFHRAVHDALKYDEFYNPKEFAAAKKLLAMGFDRAKSLREGKAPWNTETGLVVRGYVSKIDGSVQPYGLVIPPNYKGGAHPFRLDVWFHGRGETLSEVNFLAGRLASGGEFTPYGAIVLHPYGRYCNANHFAGEVDTFEAIENLSKHYPIDFSRVIVRGFSMGGAACWNFATHYAGQWAAAAPGAGFSESPDFLKVFQNEQVQPTWYEKKLFHLYDCTDWAINLSQCPTVAYSGAKDRQKQAADIMAKALAAEGIDLVHIIGPDTEHKYHPGAKVEINRRIDAIARIGRPEVPKSVHFITYTLRYNKMRWVTIDRMTEHWTPARIDADMTHKGTTVKTQGIEAFTLSMTPGAWPWDITEKPSVTIDGVTLQAPSPMSDRSWTTKFTKVRGKWITGSEESKESGLAKRHGLTGPIDDAFMDRFVLVRPTGTPLNEKVGKWADAELEHARVHWRRQFRGEAPVKDDVKVMDTDIASSNLVLFGDPSSNAVLKTIADKLPIRWNSSGIRLGEAGKNFSPDHHTVAMIYPNPLNPNKYVVLNSCFTFREYDYLNNARQIPKLPDWVVFDIDQPRTSRIAGGVADAAFFGERWELTSERR